MDTQSLTYLVSMSARALGANLEGISHEESLVQPPDGGNCVNWMAGHVLVHRNQMLQALGAAPVVDAELEARYGRGSAPVTGEGEGVQRFDHLREELSRSHQAVLDAIAAAGDAKLGEAAGKRTVGQAVGFLASHEMYHAGQVGLLRRALGKSGAIG